MREPRLFTREELIAQTHSILGKQSPGIEELKQVNLKELFKDLTRFQKEEKYYPVLAEHLANAYRLRIQKPMEIFTETEEKPKETPAKQGARYATQSEMPLIASKIKMEGFLKQAERLGFSGEKLDAIKNSFVPYNTKHYRADPRDLKNIFQRAAAGQAHLSISSGQLHHWTSQPLLKKKTK